MKKIPTLFKREFQNHKVVKISPEVTESCEWVLRGEGDATIKWDGAACAIIDGKLYRRFDAKQGRSVPKNAIPCCDPDPVTGHWPHWVPCEEGNAADKWFFDALGNTFSDRTQPTDGTFEAIGPHFQGNPYKLREDVLRKHGTDVVTVERTFDGIREWLKTHNEEGLVFWMDGEPRCKIKRSDFGFPWDGQKNKKMNETYIAPIES